MLPEGDPARTSYLNEPSFRGLILRHQYQDLEEFIDEMEEFYRPFGGKASGKPRVIEFKSKARLYFRHLGDQEAYNQARGWGLTKIGIEELTQIPEERWYLKLFGSLRGKKQVRIHGGRAYPALKTQILSTTNPDGPGREWVKKRFVKVYSGGKLIPWNTSMTDPISGLNRIFIPMKKEDNPYLRDNKQYDGMLLSQDKVTRRQWIEGDWDAGSGTYFEEFRPDGPIGDEVPWARHKIDPVELKPWWFRWGGGDWGFDHPSVWHKLCRNEKDGRIHVYDELRLRQVGSYELGVLLAKWWLPELEFLPDKQITLYISPDAFSKTDSTKTKAEQMSNGIQEILGPYGSFLLRYNDDEREAMSRDPRAAQLMFERRKSEQRSHGGICIALKPANVDRVAGWSYLHELLRFRPVRTETEDELRGRLRKMFELSGVEAYEKELSKVKDRRAEVLPRLVLWKGCFSALRFLTEAVHDDPPRSEDVKKYDAHDGIGGDDGGDSLRHSIMAFKEIEVTIPKRYWVADRMTIAQEANIAEFGMEITDPTRLMQIQRMQNARYDLSLGQKGGGSISLPRAGSMRHRGKNVQ